MSLDVTLKKMMLAEIYSRNITHNLNKMAEEAGIYKHLWRPEELGITLAGDLVEPLRIGLEKLMKNPAMFEAMNPPNGWGNYHGLVEFVNDYYNACKENPEAVIEVSR
jgi:hypothetical protein